jgi:hypothetical protein
MSSVGEEEVAEVQIFIGAVMIDANMELGAPTSEDIVITMELVGLVITTPILVETDGGMVAVEGNRTTHKEVEGGMVTDTRPLMAIVACRPAG